MSLERDMHILSITTLEGQIERLRAELAAEREQKFRHMDNSTRLCNELAAERERARSAERREGNLRDHIVHLGQRVATLRAALEPFAVAAENFDSFPIQDAEQWFAYSGVSSQKDNGKGAITVGDLRRARAALKETGGEHE